MSEAKPAFFKPITAIFLIVLVDVLGYTIILPLLPFYAERYGATPLVIGALTASYAICQLVAGPLLGRASDRIGRRPLLLFSQAGTLLGFLILAWAPSLIWLFVGRILDGITAGNISLAQATVADVTSPEQRGKAFGKIGVAFGIGFLIGPALSGFLAHYGAHWPILAGALLSFLSILATWFFLPRVSPRHGTEAGTKPRLKIIDFSQLRDYFKRPDLALRLRQFFLFILSFSLWTSGFSLFASRQLQFDGHAFGPREVGYIFAYGGLLGIILQGFLIHRLMDRFGEKRLVLFGLIGLDRTWLDTTLGSLGFLFCGDGLGSGQHSPLN
ncbi:MAG: MFS transporter [Proteobacteria bacterium]|nr:MFS transporter [Pseudomonadota bacterium]